MSKKEAWEAKAKMANERGWRLLYAAQKCFELAEAAKIEARRTP